MLVVAAASACGDDDDGDEPAESDPPAAATGGEDNPEGVVDVTNSIADSDVVASNVANGEEAPFDTVQSEST